MSKVTLWYKLIKNTDGTVKEEFNHLEDGWWFSKYPLPIKSEYTNQKAWSKDKWVKQQAYIGEDFKICDKQRKKEIT